VGFVGGLARTPFPSIWVRCHQAQPPQPRGSNLRSILSLPFFKCATILRNLPRHLYLSRIRLPYIPGQFAMVTPGIIFAGLASVLPARALAQNATASDKHVGWVSSGGGRSTSDILWSCFSILLVCTYKCIHFNVPSQKESEAGWFTWTWWWKWLKKIGWMMLIVLAPEIGVCNCHGSVSSCKSSVS
jgi:hypothetical protein